MACDLNIGSQSAAERGHILLESGLYSDLVLEVGEGAEMVKFNVHRCTLTLASSVWATTVNWAESGVIKITQFPFTTIKAVIYYIYTKTIDFQDLAHWQEVMSAAHFYDMQELQYRCEEHIQNYFKKDCVTVKEMIEILNKATLYNSRNIISSCIAFIEDNVNLVFESDCFLDLSLDSLLAIIGSDRAFSTEAFQINHVLRWSQHAMEQSKQEDLREFLEATTILSHFRLNKLLPDELKTLNLHYPNILTDAP